MSAILRKKRSTDDSTFESPSKRYKSFRLRVITDTFDREAIKRKIYEIYEWKEHVTLSSLLIKLEDAGLFSGKWMKLAELLKEMGFSYKKHEQPRIIEQRHTYLRKIMHNRVEKRLVVFLDETWANSHDGKDLAWVEEDTVTGGTLGGVKRKGTQLIILGAGGEMGWIPNTTLIFRSKKNTGDYHDKMTGDHFEEWFRDKLLPNTPPNSLIIMDNASYHSR